MNVCINANDEKLLIADILLAALCRARKQELHFSIPSAFAHTINCCTDNYMQSEREKMGRMLAFENEGKLWRRRFNWMKFFAC